MDEDPKLSKAQRRRANRKKTAESTKKPPPVGVDPVHDSQGPKPTTNVQPTPQSKIESPSSTNQIPTLDPSSKKFTEVGESSSSSTATRAEVWKAATISSDETLSSAKTPWHQITHHPTTAETKGTELNVGQRKGSTYGSSAGSSSSKAANQPDQGGKTPSQFLRSREVPLVKSQKSSMRSFQNGLETNHFRINVEKAAKLYRYDCADQIQRIEPENSSNNVPTDSNPREKKISGRIRRRIFTLLLENFRQRGIEVATDFATHLISASKLNIEEDEWTEEVLYFDEDQHNSDPNLTTFVISIKPAVEIDLHRAVNYLALGKSADAAGYVDNEDAATQLDRAIDALNLVFSHVPNQDTVRHAYKTLGNGASVGREPGVANVGADKYYSYQFARRTLPLGNAPTELPLKASTAEDALWYLDRDVEPRGLLALLGFFRSVRAPAGPTFLLNINAVTGAFYQWINLHELILRWWGDTGGSETAFRDLESFISGLRVRTTHMSRYPDWIKRVKAQNRVPREKIFTISGFPKTADLENDKDYPWVWKGNFLEEPTADKVSFRPRSDNGKELAETTLQAWWERKGHKFADYEYVIRVGDKKPLYYPASVLEVLPGQAYKRSIQMVRQACRAPASNFDYITGQASRLFGVNGQLRNQDVYKRFNIGLEPDLLKVDAFQTRLPTLLYGSGNVAVQSHRDAKWNLKELALLHTPANPFRYAIIQIQDTHWDNTAIDAMSCRNFNDLFQKHVNNTFGHGKAVFRNGSRDWKSICTANVSGQSRLNAEQNITAKIREAQGWGADIIIVVLTSKSGRTYSTVKRAGDLVIEVPTVCLQAKNLQKGDKNKNDFVANVLLKVNMKLSNQNANHTLANLRNDSQRPKLLGRKTMIVGLDVTHRGNGGMNGSPSVAAMVASRDPFFTQWPVSWRLNPVDPDSKKKSNERVEDIGEMLIERLMHWHKANNDTWPDQIIVYRDGLSEGQFDMCKEEEVKWMNTALAQHFADKSAIRPRLLVICTVKRNNCRFRGKGKESQGLTDKNDNACSGTVVFDKVTYGKGKDFFLISRKTLQGTARPTHYVVLHNEIEEISLHDIAETTYHLCFTWARSTCAVGLVPPSYYADKACDRARNYLYKLYNDFGHLHRVKFDWYKQSHVELAQIPPTSDTMVYI